MVRRPPTFTLFPYTTLFRSSYALSVVTLILFFAYAGQAWNVMMGFAGQLSLGHSLYVGIGAYVAAIRSEEHTSELQSRRDLVCRLLLEKKKNKIIRINNLKH